MEFVSYDIASNDFRRAGAASRAIKERLKRIGADAEAIRRTMIAAYEAEMNVVIHSVGGRLEASLTDSDIDVDVIDEGPGIPDIDQAMVEGYSTASAEARALGFGAGMGLPNIKRNSDRLRITSRAGEGTRVSFRVHLKPEATEAGQLISLYASADRCRDCRRCLVACPTQAMRIRDGRPSVLEHLCVDCAACIASCDRQALTTRGEIGSLDDIPHKDELVLVVPPALLAGCGPDYSPAQVIEALQRLGFRDVLLSAPFEQALLEECLLESGGEVAARTTVEDGERLASETGKPRTAATETAKSLDRPAGAPEATGSAGPVIVPSCPAIVNLIELRFPSLVPRLAPYESPLEAVQAVLGDRPAAYVVSCPGQRSALLARERQSCGEAGRDQPPRAEYLAPDVVRQAAMVVLTGGGSAAEGCGAAAGEAGMAAENHRETDAARAADGRRGAGTQATPTGAGAGSSAGDEPLVVTGIGHVLAVLDNMEDGLLDDVRVVQPFACDAGCFGSPLLADDCHVAARRWNSGRTAVDQVGATAAVHARAVRRRHPFAARPGIRLDPDMHRAIDKLGELQATIRLLPGRDCGACGAPTCAALAEDVVMQRAAIDLCPYRATEKEDRDS